MAGQGLDLNILAAVSRLTKMPKAFVPALNLAIFAIVSETGVTPTEMLN
jgi:hypothetical protein